MTTVGYNTVDISLMTPISMLILTIAMYIGASPSGTGGGLKSTTLSAIYAYISFEATSALATAGLSSGILSHITIGSKIVLILLMYIGRVGVITFGNALLIRSNYNHITGRDDIAV